MLSITLLVLIGITINKLIGGLNANTSQVESEKNFIDKIDTIRESLVKDRIINMLQIIAGTIDNKLYNLDYVFEPLYALSKKETAETIN